MDSERKPWQGWESSFKRSASGSIPPESSTKIFKSPSIHRTPRYRATSAYYGMLARCGNVNGKNPAYSNVELRMTKEEWLEWAVPQYEKFVKDFPDQSPNVSRFGDSGHYEIGNLEIICQLENVKKQKRSKTIIKSICLHCGTPFERRANGEKHTFCSRRCTGMHYGRGNKKKTDP